MKEWGGVGVNQEWRVAHLRNSSSNNISVLKFIYDLAWRSGWVKIERYRTSSLLRSLILELARSVNSCAMLSFCIKSLIKLSWRGNMQEGNVRDHFHF